VRLRRGAIPGCGITIGSGGGSPSIVAKVVVWTRPVGAGDRFEKPATAVEWRRIPLDLADAAELEFPMDIRRAGTMKPRRYSPLARQRRSKRHRGASKAAKSPARAARNILAPRSIDTTELYDF
jgi:hypothetical protein